MGRPVHKKYFGNRNPGGVGGEGIATVTLGGDNNVVPIDVTAVTLTVADPVITAGTKAVLAVESFGVASATVHTAGTEYVVGDIISIDGGTPLDADINNVATLKVDTVTTTATGDIATLSVVNAGKYTARPATNGVYTGGGSSTNEDARVNLVYKANDVVIVNPGSGYTAAPTVIVGSEANFTVTATITDVNENDLRVVAATTGNTVRRADIVRQVSDSRFLVKTSDGQTVCKLTYDSTLSAATLSITSALTAGQMAIVASDGDGHSYCITRLKNNHAWAKRIDATLANQTEKHKVTWSVTENGGRLQVNLG